MGIYLGALLVAERKTADGSKETDELGWHSGPIRPLPCAYT